MRSSSIEAGTLEPGSEKAASRGEGATPAGAVALDSKTLWSAWAGEVGDGVSVGGEVCLMFGESSETVGDGGGAFGGILDMLSAFQSLWLCARE